jgi:hypothetical protein
MKQKYMIFGIVAIVVVLIFIAWSRLKNQTSQADIDTRRPSENVLPENTIPNDKLVVVEDVSEAEIKRILKEFCNSYNKKTYDALPRLIELSDKKYAVTFPYDISFEIYCFFINYLNYPMGFDRSFKTIGWATTKPNDVWVTEKSVNKNVMLYVSDHDTEYDNVFITTSDNIGFKLGFAMREEKQLLKSPEKSYLIQPISQSDIENKEYTDFK